MNNEILVNIKEESETFLNKMTVSFNDLKVTVKDDVFLVSVNLNDPKILIGERGQTLAEIQRILRIVVRKKISEDVLIELDINDYKEKKKEALKSVAKDIADDVAFYKREKVLPPMNPYERRIIHVALQERSDIQTESVGDGFNRKVVVKPV